MAPSTLGDRPSLEGLGLEDVKELYYQNYTPEFVKVAVLGNFRANPEFRDQVLAWLNEYLTPANAKNDPARFQPKEKPLAAGNVPSLFSSDHSPAESEKRVYIKSATKRSGAMLLEVPVDKDSRTQAAIEMLVDYLAINAPGSLLHKLQVEKGWVSHGGFHMNVFRNRAHILFYYDLTDTGLEHVEDINAIFFAALRAAQLHGPPDEFLKVKKNSLLKDVSRASRSVDRFMNVYGQFLASDKTAAEQLSQMLATRTEDLRRAAALVRPDLALYMEMGPELPDMDLHPTYQREFKLMDNRKALRRYAQTLEDHPTETFQPMLRAVDLGPAPTGVVEKMFAQSRPRPDLPERLTLDLRTDLPDTAAEVRFETDARDPKPSWPGKSSSPPSPNASAAKPYTLICFITYGWERDAPKTTCFFHPPATTPTRLSR
ncbi:MAG: insulinase family protein [Calothrix sp. SM1_5_4]|nr:insulinase family protein [Calothrix sp. SM1_5_4]